MEFDNRIQVLENNTDIISIVNKIVTEGQQQESFCLCDVSEMVRRNSNWKKFFPNVPIFYDVKCNDTRIVLETQASLGTGFSCVSKEEIRRVISIGVSPDKIMFSNPTKKISQLVYAAEHGIRLTTFDNEEELYKIRKYHPSAKLILRIDTSDESKTNISNRKYGVVTNQEVKHVLNVAKSLDLNVIGVSFYVKSGSQDHREYSKAIATAKKVFITALNLGYKFTLLDIGDIYREKRKDSLNKISKAINEALDDHFFNNKVKIVAEVGSYCVESAFKIVSFIYSKRNLTNNTIMYYLDVGVYNGLTPFQLAETFIYNSLNDYSKSPLHPSILWGPTCDSIDKITAKDVEYLPEMQIGDWIIFNDTGACSLSMLSEFNGFTFPSIHSVIKNKDWFYLTRNSARPLSKSKFVKGESLDNYLTGIKAPHIFSKQYS